MRERLPSAASPSSARAMTPRYRPQSGSFYGIDYSIPCLAATAASPARRILQFGLKFFFGAAAALAAILALSAEVPVLQEWRLLYAYFTFIVVLNEKVPHHPTTPPPPPRPAPPAPHRPDLSITVARISRRPLNSAPCRRLRRFWRCCPLWQIVMGDWLCVQEMHLGI